MYCMPMYILDVHFFGVAVSTGLDFLHVGRRLKTPVICAQIICGTRHKDISVLRSEMS